MRLILAFTLVLAALVPASALAAPAGTEVVTVPATIVIQHGNRPGDPGDCSAVSFAMWADVPGTQGVTVRYVYDGKDYSKSGGPPFDDVFEWVARYEVPAGNHWLQLGKRWVNGSVPNDCSADAADYEAKYQKDAVAELTVEAIDPPIVRSLPGQVTAYGARRTAIGEVECPKGSEIACQVTCLEDTVVFKTAAKALTYAVRCPSRVRPGYTLKIGIRRVGSLPLKARGFVGPARVKVTATRGAKTVEATVSRSVRLMLGSDAP